MVAPALLFLYCRRWHQWCCFPLRRLKGAILLYLSLLLFYLAYLLAYFIVSSLGTDSFETLGSTSSS